MTNVAPNAPNTRIIVAAVIKLATGAAENGIIFIRPSYNGKLMDLDDVNGTTPSVTGEVLKWDQTNKYWYVSLNKHNDTTDKQGGTTDEYYHLTSAQYLAITSGVSGTFLTGDSPAKTVTVTNGIITSIA